MFDLLNILLYDINYKGSVGCVGCVGCFQIGWKGQKKKGVKIGGLEIAFPFGFGKM